MQQVFINIFCRVAYDQLPCFICIIVALQVVEEGVSSFMYVIVDKEMYVFTSIMFFCFGNSSYNIIFDKTALGVEKAHFELD